MAWIWLAVSEALRAVASGSRLNGQRGDDGDKKRINLFLQPSGLFTGIGAGRGVSGPGVLVHHLEELARLAGSFKASSRSSLGSSLLSAIGALLGVPPA